MPELRKDPVIGRWVIIATERAKRPHDFVTMKESIEQGVCPFCEGNEANTPKEIGAIRNGGTAPNGPGWTVRVVPNLTPILRIEGDLGRRGVGMYDVMNGVGAHEVIIETPRHIANIADLAEDQIENSIRAQVERLLDLEKDYRFKYLLLFKNYGFQAGGGGIRHARSQLIATSVTPKRVKEELLGAKQYYEFKERCLYCDMIRQELQNRERIVAENEEFIAWAPYASRFPFELCILPKEHSCDFYLMRPEQVTRLAQILKKVYSDIKEALQDPPYNSVVHTAPLRCTRLNRKAGYWRTIEQDYHWHIELMPRLTRVAGFEWGSGFYINPVTPEQAAQVLRKTGNTSNIYGTTAS
ncbi:MAG: DUF4931 domain-containing protein [Candidatus Omnitrophica bacterium]|nr:DUF4931 domain-containing protein [Candidatus Omnitrophota bacterium]